MAGHPSSLIATTTAQVALYILNNKRKFITELEAHHGISISVQASDKLQGANFTIEKTQARTDAPPRRSERTAVNMDWGFEGEDDGAAEALEDERPSASDGVRFIGETDDEEAEPDRPRIREGRGRRDEGRRMKVVAKLAAKAGKRATMAMVKTVAVAAAVGAVAGGAVANVADGARNAQTIAARSEPWPMGPTLMTETRATISDRRPRVRRN